MLVAKHVKPSKPSKLSCLSAYWASQDPGRDTHLWTYAQVCGASSAVQQRQGIRQLTQAQLDLRQAEGSGGCGHADGCGAATASGQVACGACAVAAACALEPAAGAAACPADDVPEAAFQGFCDQHKLWQGTQYEFM